MSKRLDQTIATSAIIAPEVCNGLLGALRGNCVAIDGSKFKSVNSCDRNLTARKISNPLMHLEADISRYIDEMVRIDCEETGETRAANVVNFATRHGRIQQEITRLKDMDTALADTPDRCSG